MCVCVCTTGVCVCVCVYDRCMSVCDRCMTVYDRSMTVCVTVQNGDGYVDSEAKLKKIKDAIEAALK